MNFPRSRQSCRRSWFHLSASVRQPASRAVTSRRALRAVWQMVNFSSSSEYRAAKSGRQATAVRKCCVSQGVKRRDLLLAASSRTCRLGFRVSRRVCFILGRDFVQFDLKLLHRHFEQTKLSIGSGQIAAAAHCFEVFGSSDGGLSSKDCNGTL